MRAWLFNTKVGHFVESFLAETTAEHVEQVNATWVPAFQRRQRSQVHDEDFVMWSKGTRYLDLIPDREGVRGSVLECDSIVQGVLVVCDNGESSRVDRSDRVLTVRYVATAPWNRPEGGRPGRYRGVGTTLMRHAVRQSMAYGYGGRIGLHSLASSHEFYRRLGLIDFGPDPASRGLRYFELHDAESSRLAEPPARAHR